MLSSPISVTIAGTAHSLIRISGPDTNGASIFLKKDTNKEYRVTIRHSLEKAKAGLPTYERHNVELKITEFPVTVNDRLKETTVYSVFRNVQGATVTSVTDLIAGLQTFITANQAAIVGGAS